MLSYENCPSSNVILIYKTGRILKENVMRTYVLLCLEKKKISVSLSLFLRILIPENLLIDWNEQIKSLA